MLTGGDPSPDPILRIGLGVLMLLLGLQSLFRLAAFGPRTLTSNRVKESLAGCALVLLGAAQMASNRYVMLAMGVTGLLCAIAMALGRPKRLFARSSHAEVSRR